MNDPTKPTIEEMLADLEASEAEVAAGQIIPGEKVMADLQEKLDRWLRDHSYESRRRLGM